MKRLILLSLVFGLIFLMGGCVPKRVVWSPDGTKAMVLGEDGVYLTDPEGHFNRALAYAKASSQPATSPASNNGIDSVDLAAWLPNSKQAIFMAKYKVHTWSELKVISKTDQKNLAARMARFEHDILSSTDVQKVIRDAINEASTAGEEEIFRFYVTQHMSPAVKKIIGSLWKDSAKDNLELSLLERYSIENRSFSSPIVLATSFNDITEIRPSPDGRYIAYVEGKGDDKSRFLKVVPVDRSAESHLVAEDVNDYPDWTPDGLSVVYIKRENKAPSISLGILSRLQICNEKGQLTPGTKAEDLAGVLYGDGVKIRCLPDGRILFSGMSMMLPCTASQMPKQPTLFILDLARYPGVIPAIPAQVERPLDGLMWYEPSPDGRYVSIPSSDGRVFLLELSTGQVTEIQSVAEPCNKDEIKLRTTPVWRNKDELCFAVPPGSSMGSPKRAEIVLYSLSEKKGRCISKSWPDEAVKNFLKGK